MREALGAWPAAKKAAEVEGLKLAPPKALEISVKVMRRRDVNKVFATNPKRDFGWMPR